MNNAALLGGALLLFSGASPAPRQLRPVDKRDKPLWKGCDELKPVPKADDGSMVETCEDADGRKWEVVYRPHGQRQCTAIAPKEPDGYQHFMCSEQYELMLKPQPKEAPHAPAAPQATVPDAEGRLPEPR